MSIRRTTAFPMPHAVWDATYKVEQSSEVLR